MMNFNEETDILDRLGILDSKLECPNKQLLVAKEKDKSASRHANSTSLCCVTAVEDVDGWGAFSLDELNSSSDDSEFLFDRRDFDANGKKNRKVRNYRQGDVKLHCLSRTGTPNSWKSFALLSVASFALCFCVLFIVAMAFGKFAGPLGFVWWNGNGSEESISHSPFEASAIFFFGFGILVLSYMLFLLMLSKLRKSQRQQQISQLSVALNGNVQKRRKAKSSKGHTKGPYKELLSSAVGDETNDANFAHRILDYSEEDKESEDIADMEMDSIGGEEEESDREQRTDKREERVNSLV